MFVMGAEDIAGINQSVEFTNDLLISMNEEILSVKQEVGEVGACQSAIKIPKFLTPAGFLSDLKENPEFEAVFVKSDVVLQTSSKSVQDDISDPLRQRCRDLQRHTEALEGFERQLINRSGSSVKVYYSLSRRDPAWVRNAVFVHCSEEVDVLGKVKRGTIEDLSLGARDFVERVWAQSIC